MRRRNGRRRGDGRNRGESYITGNVEARKTRADCFFYKNDLKVIFLFLITKECFFLLFLKFKFKELTFPLSYSISLICTEDTNIHTYMAERGNLARNIYMYIYFFSMTNHVMWL